MATEKDWAWRFSKKRDEIAALEAAYNFAAPGEVIPIPQPIDSGFWFKIILYVISHSLVFLIGALTAYLTRR